MINATNITLRYGGRTLFEGITFLINPKDRIGLIGKNGVGKTTLLNIMAGCQQPDEGQVVIQEGKKIGYLPQEIKINSKRTVYNEALTAFQAIRKVEKEIEQINEALHKVTDYESPEYLDLLNKLSLKHEQAAVLGANQMEGEVEKILKGLGFEAIDFDRPLNEFSGGWQMRVELAKLLLQMPDLLLLDEPTNHLDIESILWLEDLFIQYPGAIMMVSHDRMFLDKVTNRTMELTFGKCYDAKFPYSKYLTVREERLEQQQAAYKNQQRQIEQTERLIDRFRAKNTKASFAQSLMKKLDRMEKIEFDEIDRQAINFRFPPAPRSGQVVVEGKHLSKHYGDVKVLNDLHFKIERGDRIAFVGRNGEGKTTMVKLIIKEENHTGQLTIGHNVETGYYAQVQEHTMDEEKTVLKTIEDEATGEWRTIHRIRGLLGAFLFDEEAVDKKVKVLSGGEKSRLALAKLLLKPVNLLILDEPTNHLDIPAKAVLKQALMQYDGTLILVSHDRDFLQGLTNRTFEFSHHKIKEHLGEINEFLSKHKVQSFREFEAGGKGAKGAGGSTKEPKAASPTSSNKLTYEARKEREKELRKTKNAISKIEKTIADLETETSELETAMQAFDFYDDREKADASVARYETCKQQLEAAMENWEALQLKVEELGGEEGALD